MSDQHQPAASQPGKLFALKLFIAQLAQVKCLTAQDNPKAIYQFEGLPFDRLWVQGIVAEKAPGKLTVDDGTGKLRIQTKRVEQDPEYQQLLSGDYILVTGLLKQMKASTWALGAHKVKILDSPDQRSALWHTQIRFLHDCVYPELVARNLEVARNTALSS